MFKQIAHICIGSTDLKACEDFYCGVLGLSKGFEFDKQGTIIGFYIKVGNNTFIEVFVQDEAANLERPIIRHMCLEVDDMDKVIETVRSHDWEITDKKMGADHSWQAWLTDPDGVSIELHQYTPESTQMTGETCYVNW